MITIEQLEEQAEKERCAGNRDKFLDIQKQIEIQKEERVLAAHLNYLKSVKKDFPVGFYIPELHTNVKEIKEGCGTQRGWIEIYLSGYEKSYKPHELRKKIREAQEAKESKEVFGKLKFNDKKLSLCIGKKNLDTLDMLIRVMGLDLPTEEEVDEWNMDLYCEVMSEAKRQAITDGYTDDEAENKAEEAEAEVMKEQYDNYNKSVRNTLNYLLNFHGLNFVENKTHMYLIAEKSWKDVAEKVRETINGMGPFYYESVKEFKDVGPYKSYCDAVSSHLHWLKHYPEVYGCTGYRKIFER